MMRGKAGDVSTGIGAAGAADFNIGTGTVTLPGNISASSLTFDAAYTIAPDTAEVLTITNDVTGANGIIAVIDASVTSNNLDKEGARIQYKQSRQIVESGRSSGKSRMKPGYL